MRTITETKTIYHFNELSEKAKERAKYNFACAFGYNWGDEAIESMKALAQHFDGKMHRYEIDFFGGSYSFARFDMPDDMEHKEIFRRLEELGTYACDTLHGHGDCKLTGYCSDEDAIDGFRQEFYQWGFAGYGWENYNELERLMQAAFRNWLKKCQADCEYQYSDEAFAENCEANEYEFYENGDMVPSRLRAQASA